MLSPGAATMRRRRASVSAAEGSQFENQEKASLPPTPSRSVKDVTCASWWDQASDRIGRARMVKPERGRLFRGPDCCAPCVGRVEVNVCPPVKRNAATAAPPRPLPGRPKGRPAAHREGLRAGAGCLLHHVGLVVASRGHNGDALPRQRRGPLALGVALAAAAGQTEVDHPDAEGARVIVEPLVRA
jgi:hypothetical protein